MEGREGEMGHGGWGESRAAARYVCALRLKASLLGQVGSQSQRCWGLWLVMVNRLQDAE